MMPLFMQPPSPKDIRLQIATIEKRIEHKEKHAEAIGQEAEARIELLRTAIPQSSCSLRQADARDSQIEAIHDEAEARCGLIQLDIEAYKQEKKNAEKALEMLSSPLVVPGVRVQG